MDDEYLTFEVIPEKPVFEILGGVEMLHKTQTFNEFLRDEILYDLFTMESDL